MSGAEIAAVYPHSIAENYGLREGEVILALDQEPLSDYLGYKYASFGSKIRLRLWREGAGERTLLIEKEPGEPLGLQLKGYIYDQLQECANNCLFCFIDQQPEGMRPALRKKDDDYRFSFYQGSFITMTNLSEDDFQRIEREHLSPLYISIHTTNPRLRKRMLENPRADKILTQLRRLHEAGISFHGQMVLCPGINDGDQLERSIEELREFFPALASLGLIPVGLTRYSNQELRPYSPQEASRLIERVNEWQQDLRESYGRSLIYAADELYLKSDSQLPEVDEYDGFPQYENGVGIVSSFYQEYNQLRNEGLKLPERDFNLVTSSLGYRALSPLLEELEADYGLKLHPLVIENRFFGPQVTVTGLLTGQDIIEQVNEKSLMGEVLLLPDILLNDDHLFLDNIHLSRLRESLEQEVILLPSDAGGFLSQLEELGA